MSKVATRFGQLCRVARIIILGTVSAGLSSFNGMGCIGEEPEGLVQRFGFSAIVFASKSIPPNSGSLTVSGSFSPGGNLYLLEPAAPGGELFNLTRMDQGDVLGLDVAPDGGSVIASIKVDHNDRYHLYLIDLKAAKVKGSCFADQGDLGPACIRITFGSCDDTRPFFLRNGRIAFYRTNPDGQVDFKSRSRARVLYSVKADGSDIKRLDAGPGHALGASELSENRLSLVRFTERDGVGRFVSFEIDTGDLRGENPASLEISSQAIPLNPVQDIFGDKFAACVPESGTWEAGTLCKYEESGWNSIVSDMPVGDGCSPKGRIQDPYPLPDGRFLVTYVHVPTGCSNYQDTDLEKIPDIGIGILDPKFAELRPVYNRPNQAEMFPKPVIKKPWYDPNAESEPDQACEQSGMVFQGYVGNDLINAGAIGIRVIRALSGEVAPWVMELGGLPGGAMCTDSEQSPALLDRWVAPIFGDGSFRFTAPEQVPLRLQVIDRYGATLAADPIWRGDTACKVRSCSGCHSNQGVVEGFETSQAASADPHQLDAPDDQKISYQFRVDIQPILDRSCALSNCHDSATAAGNYVTLNGQLRGVRLDGEILGRTTVSYQNLLFLDQQRDSQTGEIIAQRRAFVSPGRARDSRLLRRLGVPCRYDCNGQPAWAPWAQGGSDAHPEDQPGWTGEFSPQDRWKLVEWIEMGAAFLGLGSQP